MLADNLAGHRGLLVGVVGFGTIGTAVAQAFQRMGCRIAFYDPAPRDLAPAQALGARSMSLDDLLAAADVVTLHVPLIAATRGTDRRRASLQPMKPGAVLIQAARGGIVDEAALAAASARPAISAAPPSTSIRPSRPRPTIRCSRSTARRRAGCC